MCFIRNYERFVDRKEMKKFLGIGQPTTKERWLLKLEQDSHDIQCTSFMRKNMLSNT